MCQRTYILFNITLVLLYFQDIASMIFPSNISKTLKTYMQMF